MSASQDHKLDRIKAFEAVVSEYERPLLRYAARLLNRSDAAQDVVQETFLRLFTRWKDAVTPSPALSAWLFRVCHNRAVDHMRHEQRHGDLIDRGAEAGQLDEIAQPETGREGGIDDAALRAVESLNSLSPRERQVVILKVYEEKSYKEIGEITGLSTGNVGYILHHALRKMAERLRGVKSI